MELSKLSLKSSKLYLRNPVDHLVWQPYFFMLTQDRLYFTELEGDQDNDQEDTASAFRVTSDVCILQVGQVSYLHVLPVLW